MTCLLEFQDILRIDELKSFLYTGSWKFVSDNTPPTFFDFEVFEVYGQNEYAVAISTREPFRWITADRTSRWSCICQISEFHQPFELFSHKIMLDV